MIKHKSTLAKLLAKENIHVQYGNYQTAWFDIKNRVLGIPMWKDMGQDVSDLFIGHEVGHALFTPYEGWHDSPEKLEGCPRTYINVLEDARIERKIKDAYAGLVGPMARGYTKLYNQGFFGEDFIDVDWDEVKLIDKLNLKAKIGRHLDVPMNDEEMVFYERSMNTNTFDEVLQLVRDVLAYTKEFQEDLLTPPPAPKEMEGGNDEQEMDGPGPSGHDDFEGEQQDSQEDHDSAPDLEAEEEKPSQSTPQQQDAPKADDDDEKVDKGNPKQDEDVSISDENFRRSEHKLLEKEENGTQPLVGNEFSKEVRKELVTPYKVLAKERKERMEANFNMLDDISSSYKSKSWDEINEKYPAYLKQVKKNVNFAVKEFEMRKAGYRYTRAQTAKTGSIDVNRLWSYKTNDDIFARVTRLADAKNHGMMMFIDFSGSMNDTIPEVMDQLLHLAVFCKAVNIPFDVYGFTNTNTNLAQWRYDTDPATIKTVDSKESEISHAGLSLPQLITSTLKKKDYDEALKHIYLRAQLAKDSYSYRERYILSPNEDYGSTPLNQTLIAAHRMVDSFKRANNIDNMNLVVISDGDTNSIDVVKNPNREYTSVNRYGKTYINIMNKNVRLESNGKDGTESLLKNLQKKFGVTTIGFFIADSGHNFKRKIYDCDRDAYWDDEVKKYNREYSKNKCVRFKDALGYSEFYIVKSGKQLATESLEFAPDVEASKGQITTAFKKFSKSKKVNKALLTNFGKVVAE